MAWNKEGLRRLRQELAKLYPGPTDSRIVVVDAGLDPARIAFESKAINNWFNILEYAESQNKVDAILAAALRDFPGNEVLESAAKGTPPPILEGPEPKVWHGPGDKRQVEKIIGPQSTLVSINHLEIGMIRSRSVARIRLPDGSSGTGFLIKNNVLVTANHVLPDVSVAKSAVVQFNYQETVRGTISPMEELELNPDEFFTGSKADDWTAVRIVGSANKEWGALDLKTETPKVGDHVNIIQHAGGGPKQISFSGNVIVYVGAGRIQYLTDTLPGSSGSPVFNQHWDVIGVHHSGGWLSEPGDANRTTFYRNEGTLADRVIDGIAKTVS